jgi:3-oxoacyl-[acyl-carrier-protein] synthase II
VERVLVTGLGLVSCLGNDLETYWAGLSRAESVPAPTPDPHARMDNRLIYGVGEMAPPTLRQGAPNPGRGSTYALHAAESALRDAGLDEIADGNAGAGVGIAIGTAVGDVSLFEAAAVGGPVPRDLDGYPFKVSSALADQFRTTGPMVSVSTACSSSLYSISLAADAIRDGTAEVVIAGGAESYTRVGGACFNRMGGLDPDRCQPFSAQRRGTVFGEGAAMMILESGSHARGRGWTRSYASIDGAGWSCDGHHATAPEPQATQIVRAVHAALADAGISPADVGVVVPHGTGTPLNDTIESRALEEVFGPLIKAIPVYSLKAMLGHTAGAAGAFSLVTAALMLYRDAVPPNVAIQAPDPDCPFVLHTDATQPAGGSALVSGYAFGGNNISVVIGRG